MSAGTRITTVRIPSHLRQQCSEYLEARSSIPTVEPWTMSDLILVALAEKMQKIERGKAAYRRSLRAREAVLDEPNAFEVEVMAEAMFGEGGGM